MTLNQNGESQQHIEQVAGEALDQFERIADKAKSKLQGEQTASSDAFASVNTLTSTEAVQSLGDSRQANRESYQILAKEPAIARVVVVDAEGNERIYYICRTAPPTGFKSLSNSNAPVLSSYRAPLGRLASLDIGATFTLPGGSIVEVIERATLRPQMLVDGWDSRNTVVEAENFGPVTVESLRALLTQVAGEEAAEDLLSQLLAEENAAANIIQGLRRSVITKMGLRDQPILDQYQDEIFRLPLDQRLLILGPPGTGKTTTLIRRLGQKLDAGFLDEAEQRLVESITSSQGAMHAHSWLMFTPTELLKQYLKEAFAREGVPAPDQNIKTWRDYQRELARSVFGVLKTASGSGIFILKEGLNCLQEMALNNPIQWFDDFDGWQRKAFLQELHDAANQLKNANHSEAHKLGVRLHGILPKDADSSIAAVFGQLAVEMPNVQVLVSSLKESSDAIITSALRLQANRNRAFLDELASLIDSLQQGSATEPDDLDDSDADEDEDVSGPRTGRAAALAAYMKAVRAQAKAAASKRAMSKTSRNGKIIEWLGDRGLKETDLVEVGASLLVQANARRFVNPVKRYLDNIPKHYRAFRRERQQAKSWYLPSGFEARDIHPLELDIVLLAMLRATGDLLSRPNVQRAIDEPAWSSLKTIHGHYRNQILVDEATDFSPIQLASMAALTHPRLRSFFACGDFNQRLTTWGARSSDELKWVFPDVEIKAISVTYRQSKQLNDLAHAMIQVMGGNEQHASLPEHMDSTGVAPALLEYASAPDAVVLWLAERIREIERFVGQLPSTAVFVNSESEVSPVAEALNQALGEHNIQVVACREGQAVGQESSVRVFDIQHIKGLEFEAVFFIGVDQLASLHPALFDKYLYVGTTRAATYLGVTCQGSLPPAIDGLRSHFCQDWQQGN
ncbi:ATP-binding domain-containing protein [Aeromonas caviae]|uniref:ATP-binding domain-containing protein n=1 Tax=Aeromonas caviae TaxID=648 RepID=UPI002B248BCD|nr:ATP-binding domain-containing protein [Aeromonas caviae]MEA9423595.1 ATP-binding domain-containing protein [Aeromonas caviae]